MNNISTIAVLTGTDPMPFGKFVGRAMQDVPACYLHWLWHQEPRNPYAVFSSFGLHRATTEKYIPTVSNNTLAVRDYIKRNMSDLQLETQDLVWDTTKE
jgi:hypothetical protein